MVEARRDGKWMHYRIVEPENKIAARIFREMLEGLSDQDEMRQDYEKLSVACCAPMAPVTIMRAPKPDIFAETNVLSFKKEELETYLL